MVNECRLSTGPPPCIYPLDWSDPAIPLPIIGVQILGMYNSGTNLLRQLLTLNLGLQDCSGHDSEGESFLCTSKEHLRAPGICKHSPPLDPRLLEFIGKSYHAVIAVVRAPLAQIAAWRKRPYALGDTGNCMALNYTLAEADGMPCMLPFFREPPFNARNPAYRVPEFHIAVQGVTRIWNYFRSGFEELRRLSPAAQVLFVEYEALVLDPAGVVRRLGKALGLEPPRMVLPVEVPSKNHGEPVSRAVARARILNRTHLREFMDEEVARVCHRLDKSLASQHRVAYASPGKGNRPTGVLSYLSDCTDNRGRKPR